LISAASRLKALSSDPATSHTQALQLLRGIRGILVIFEILVNSVGVRKYGMWVEEKLPKQGQIVARER
jgi:hypothetical protein